MSILAKRIRAIALCLPGALVVGFCGFMLATLKSAFDESNNGRHCMLSDFAVDCMFFWHIFGGASLGATPGLILGCCYRMKWPYPFLGAALGTLVSVVALCFVGGDTRWLFENQWLPAALVLLGCLFGSWPFLTGSSTFNSRKPVEKALVHRELLRDLDTSRSGRIVPKK
jgi:hypothetical protein